ncbi:MAG: hypothetical protein KJO79_06435 [Verrucomicrobiae bacterium]|nr:hypothetical protein [Verrucomicrobiae bacterium]NNJ86798.1 hypothetical protein [Akkermansiaceae bacterium]
MLSKIFRQAAKACGEYCPDREELRVRRGSKIYRFICRECRLRFAAPGQQEVEFYIAPDATVRELRRAIAEIIDSQEPPDLLQENQ